MTRDEWKVRALDETLRRTGDRSMTYAEANEVMFLIGYHVDCDGVEMSPWIGPEEFVTTELGEIRAKAGGAR